MKKQHLLECEFNFQFGILKLFKYIWIRSAVVALLSMKMRVVQPILNTKNSSKTIDVNVRYRIKVNINLSNFED